MMPYLVLHVWLSSPCQAGNGGKTWLSNMGYFDLLSFFLN